MTVVTLYSCKNEDKTSAPAEDQNIVKVTLTALVKKDDTFQLFYKGDEPQFAEENSFYVPVKGSDAPQDIVFNLPADVIPNYIRLDFGMNKEQGEMIVQNFKMNYMDKSFETKGATFFDYFYGNDQAQKVEIANSKIIPIVAENGGYDPMFASGDGLRKQIDLLVK